MPGDDTVLRGEHFRFVSLDTAMRDPAYCLQDPYVGPNEDEWLSRWSLALHRDLPWATLPPLPAELAPTLAPPPGCELIA